MKLVDQLDFVFAQVQLNEIAHILRQVQILDQIVGKVQGAKVLQLCQT